MPQIPSVTSPRQTPCPPAMQARGLGRNVLTMSSLTRLAFAFLSLGSVLLVWAARSSP